MIDRAIVTMKYYAIYIMALFPVTSSDPSESRRCSASNNAKMAQDMSCGRPTGRRMVYQRLHFQWPWMTSNPNFKRMPLFNIEYLRNGSTYRHNCKNTGPTQRCNFEWPRVIMSDLAKFPTRSVVRPICDSWASSLYGVVVNINESVEVTLYSCSFAERKVTLRMSGVALQTIRHGFSVILT